MRYVENHRFHSDYVLFFRILKLLLHIPDNHGDRAAQATSPLLIDRRCLYGQVFTEEQSTTLQNTLKYDKTHWRFALRERSNFSL